MLGKLACVQKPLLGAFSSLIVIGVRLQVRLGQQTSREEDQKTRNLIEQYATGPLDEQRIVLD
jgi:hypothetical protein